MLATVSSQAGGTSHVMGHTMSPVTTEKPRTQKLQGGMVVDGFDRPAGKAHSDVIGSSVAWKPQVQSRPTASAEQPAMAVKVPARGVGFDKAAGAPVDAPIRNEPGARSTGAYDAALDQFNVKDNPRYAAGNGKTYCNIFVNDATRAMGAEIPTAYNDATGEPAKFNKSTGKYEGGYEHNANGMVDWLNKHGEKKGWKKVSAEEAQQYANKGKPSVAAWKNPTGKSGHVAMIRPGQMDASKGPEIAQAGGTNFPHGKVSDGFKGVENKKEIEYWVHE